MKATSNAKQRAAYVSAYYKLHPEKKRQYDATQRGKLKDRNEVVSKGNCKCVVCGMVFLDLDAHTRGFLFVSAYRCVCDSCR